MSFLGKTGDDDDGMHHLPRPTKGGCPVCLIGHVRTECSNPPVEDRGVEIPQGHGEERWSGRMEGRDGTEGEIECRTLNSKARPGDVVA